MTFDPTKPFQVEGVSGGFDPAKPFEVDTQSAEHPLPIPPIPPDRGVGEQIMRGVAMPAQGFNESLATTVGALPDAAAWGLRSLGVPTSKPGQYTDWVREILQRVTGKPSPPENTLERVLQGAGKGAGDAASVFLPAAGIANLAKAGGMTQGVASTLASQPALQALSGAAGGAVTEGTGSPLAGLATAVATPFAANIGRGLISPGAVPPARQAIVDTANREGIPLSPGVRSDSPPLRWADTVFRNYPMTARTQSAVEDETRKGFNRAVLSRAGVNADRATPEVMFNLDSTLARRFEDAASKVTVSLDDQFLGDIQEVATRYGTKLSSQQKPAFEAYVSDIMNAGNSMPGATYQVARSDLTRQARAATQSDPFFASTLRGLRDALDNVAERSMSPETASDWRQLRREYGNYKTIKRALSGAGERVAEGNISPAGLRQAINAYDKDAYALGRDDLSELARVGQVVRDLPQSGTSPQANMTNLLTLGTAGAGAGAGTALGHDPLTAAMMATMGPWAAQKVYQSSPVQGWLSNQLVGRSPVKGGTEAAIMAADPMMRQALIDALRGGQ